jgi:hypothetical protein
VIVQLQFEGVAPVRAVLGLDPVAPAGEVMPAALLGDDPLQTKLADLPPQRFSVRVAGGGRPVVAVEGEVFEQSAAFPVESAVNGSPVDREHVKHDQHQRPRDSHTWDDGLCGVARSLLR